MEAKTSANVSNISHPDTTLHQAVKDRDLVIVNRILNQNESWKATDDDGDTVLHLAFSNKERIVDEQHKIIQILVSFLNKGLSINIKNLEGKTILYSAVENRLRDVIDFLIKCWTDLNVRDQNGNSIIHFLIEDQYNKFSDYCKAYKSLEDRQTFEHEDIDFLSFLLKKSVNVDFRNNNGKTPLDLAISHNLQHVMLILIRHMNDVKYFDQNGQTLIEVFFRTKESMHIRSNIVDFGKLMTAFDMNYGFRYEVDIVKFLLNKGVTVDNVNKQGDTLVHTFLKTYTQSQEVIQRMLQRYTNINHQDEAGNTALHLVINKSRALSWKPKKYTCDFVRLLLSKGADVHLKNHQGETPVRQAVRYKQTEVLQTLVWYGANLSPSKNGGNLLFELNKNINYAIDEKTYAIMVDILVHAGNDVNEVKYDRTFLLDACTDCRPLVAQKLIENGANVNYTDKQLNTPLHIAALNICDNEDLFKAFSKAGADVNAKNKDGETPLHLALSCSYISIETLLELGADVEVIGKDGDLPLHKAINNLNSEGIQAMLEFGASINDEGVLKEIKGIEELYKSSDNFYTIAKCANTIRCLAEHWIKLKAVNLPVIGGSTVYVSEDDHQQYYNECLQEVETLKEHWLDGRITLYNLLQMDVRLKSALIVNNKALSKLVKSPLLVNSFPNYHTLVLARYNQSVARNPLLELAKQAWYHLTEIYLPDICIERILAHMKNEELRMMAQEEKEINYLKRPNQLSSYEVAKKSKLI